VEESWKAKETKRVIEIAREVLNLLDLKKEQVPSRLPGMSSIIPRERSGEVKSFPDGPSEIQPGPGMGSPADMPVYQDHFSLPKPYIDLENQAAPYARQLADSLKVPTPEVRLDPHEYAGRFNMRQDLRTPETPTTT